MCWFFTSTTGQTSKFKELCPSPTAYGVLLLGVLRIHSCFEQ